MASGQSTAERDAAFQRGVVAYRAGRHYEAHEHWEEIWKWEDDLARRSFLQGLIQVAAAMHKLLVMKSSSGAVRLLDRAHARLCAASEGSEGLAVRALCADVLRARAEIERLAREEESTELPAELVPRLEPAPS
jgi:uncharacterized protein